MKKKIIVALMMTIFCLLTVSCGDIGQDSEVAENIAGQAESEDAIDFGNIENDVADAELETSGTSGSGDAENDTAGEDVEAAGTETPDTSADAAGTGTSDTLAEAAGTETPDTSVEAAGTETSDTNTEESAEMKLQVQAGGEVFTATLEDNIAVDAFTEMLEEAPITIDMSDYAGFEKVGSLGTTLPSADSRITTSSGDIVLYNSSQIVIFYGSNTWSYTRLAKIDDLTGWENALGSGDITVTFTLLQ